MSITAAHLLMEVARLRAGEAVLIHAASSGVDSMAVQLARQLGALRILGTVGSQEKIAAAQALGYRWVVLRTYFVQEVEQFTEGRGGRYHPGCRRRADA